MNVSEIVGASEYKKGYGRKRRLARMMILIFGLASVILIVLTYYGHNAGNFSIKINDEASRAIVISETKEGLYDDPKTRLSAPAIRNATDMTYSDIMESDSFEKAVHGEGVYKDPRHNYTAYSYYVMNSSTGPLAGTLFFTIRVVEEHKNLASAMRVMLVEQDMDGNLKSQVFRKKDDKINSGEAGEYITWDETEWQGKEVVSGAIPAFAKSDWRKFTVFIWLEGNDPDTNDDILGGKVKFDMVLTINASD